MAIEQTTRSEEETMEFGRQLAGELGTGDVVCLEGDLGAGKTYLVKGIASAFGVDPSEVTSPSYTLIQEYQGEIPIYHFDWYRIESPEEAVEIGTEEYFYGDGISIIEWPEKIKSLIPDHAIWIRIESLDATTRKFSVDKKLK